MFNDYALIIGVEDYSAYDLSMNLPAGTSTAAGAVNDARALYRQCLSMGFSPERIRVLTSPRLSAKDLGPEARDAMLGDATHDSIVAAITELSDAISKGVPASGLLAFSGHGFSSGGVALCPSDLTGSLDQVIHVAAIRASLGQGRGTDNLTMLLDCCRAQNGIDGDASMRARLVNKMAAMRKFDMPERIIASCSDGEVAEASMFGGVRMGAFTWAITSAMGQWKMTVEKDVARLDVSYGELTSRTKQLLAALSFEQDPELTGPQNVDALPFLHPGPTVHWGETSREPDAVRGQWQIDSGEYNLRYWTGQVDRLGNKIWKNFANIDVRPDQSTGVMTEYWTVCTDLVHGISSALELQMVRGLQTLSSTNTITETALSSTVWQSASSPSYPTGSSFTTFSVSSPNYTYNALGSQGALCASFQTRLISGNSYKLAQVVWYNPTNSNLTMSYELDGIIAWGAPGTATSYSGNCYVAASTF